MQAMLACLAGQYVGAPKTINNAADLRERIRGVGAGLLQIVRELGSKVADQPPGQGACQVDRSCLGGHLLLSVFTYCVGSERAGGIEEHVVRSIVARSTEAR